MSTRRLAALAGVSPTTVSLALRNHPKIPAATRQRVLELARQIGYRPDARVAELMSHLRSKRPARPEACLGVISFYDSARPWEQSPHFQRIHAGMTERAEALGYRLEPFWLRAPGMTSRRVRGILDARGIQGLLCFGSPDIDEEMPRELDHYAIVTQGLSIRTPLHRVIHNVSNDMWRLLKKIHGLGYRRPGLIIGDYEGVRSAHAYLCVYLGWSQLVLGTPSAIPVLQLKEPDQKLILPWIDRHHPDVLIFAHHHTMLAPFHDILQSSRLRTPGDLGVAVISQILDGTPFSGMESNQHLMGAWAVEALVARIINRDFGLPAHPRTEMVDSNWIDGRSLRPQRARAGA
jgi:LacI family transcriptional regulator